MNRTRAERKHHHQRMLERAREIAGLQGLGNWFSKEEFEKHIRKLAENRKKCSCWMCGNARKMFNQKTLQETKFEQYKKDYE